MPLNFKRIFIIALMVVVWTHVRSQSRGWVGSIRATGSSQMDAFYGTSGMTVDAERNIVIAGHYTGTLSFGDFTLTSEEDDSYVDVFICRIGPDHEVQWLKGFDAKFNYGDDIAVHTDDDKNIYLTGTFDSKIYVSKYDVDGELLWSTEFGDGSYGYGTAVKTDMYDNVYVIGSSGWEFFAAKVDNAGQILWKKSIWVNYSAGCYLTDLEVDAAGNLYFVGTHQIDLPLDDIMLTYSGSWGPTLFWGKMDTEGNFVWVKTTSGRSGERNSISLTNDGHLILAGAVASSQIGFDNHVVNRGNCCEGYTSFIAKSDTDGNVVWAKAGTDNYYGSAARDMQTDAAGNIYLTGSYFTCTPCSELDFYFEKYDAEANPLWREDYEGGDYDVAHAIDVDNNGTLYLLGLNNSPTFTDPEEWSEQITYGLGFYNTADNTYKHTERPETNKFISVCDLNANAVQLEAAGTNIKWYSDAATTDLIGQGNELSLTLTQSETVYVTQTINDVVSWPKLVVIHVPEFPDSTLIYDEASKRLTAPGGFSYQWFYDGVPREGATRRSVSVGVGEVAENFSVVISDGKCEKLLSQVITSVEDESNNGVVAYPNPTSSSFHISTGLSASQQSSIIIKNSLGQPVHCEAQRTADGYLVDLASQPAGIYLVEIDGNELHRLVKIIKL